MTRAQAVEKNFAGVVGQVKNGSGPAGRFFKRLQVAEDRLHGRALELRVYLAHAHVVFGAQIDDVARDGVAHRHGQRVDRGRDAPADGGYQPRGERIVPVLGRPVGILDGQKGAQAPVKHLRGSRRRLTKVNVSDPLQNVVHQPVLLFLRGNRQADRIGGLAHKTWNTIQTHFHLRYPLFPLRCAVGSSTSSCQPLFFTSHRSNFAV